LECAFQTTVRASSCLQGHWPQISIELDREEATK
jgi:hypothetical protein